MKLHDFATRAPVSLCLAGLVWLAGSRSTMAAEPTEAQAAWQAVLKASQPPMPPGMRDGKPPPEEEVAEWRRRRALAIVTAAEKAKDFYTRFPDDPNAPNAKKKEAELLEIATKLKVAAAAPRAAELEAEKLKDPNLPEAERLKMRMQAVQREAMALQSQGIAAVLDKMEAGAWQLTKEFPGRTEPYDLLLMVAANGDAEKAQKVAAAIQAGQAPDTVKEQARKLVAKFEALGKPVDIKFKAVDGREVDLAAMKGKVVLIDFWATWCGPCVAELPHVLETYEKLHPKGFEIVGISFDQDKEALESFVKGKKMAWPQFFDGEGWGNQFGKQFGINSIPAMWLVGKDGKLRELNARGGLTERVEKLLAE